MERSFVAFELSTKVEEFPEDILCTSIYIVRGAIRTVVHEDVEEVTLDLLSENVIREPLEAHVVKFLKMDVATNSLKNRLLAFGFIREPVVSFLKNIADTVIKKKH